MALSREEIAARYGKALFGYAQDMKVLDQVNQELGVLREAILANKKIVSVLSDPVLSKVEKASILKNISQPFSKEVQNILSLLLEYNRFGNIVEIIDYLKDLYDEEKKIASGIVTTAVKLDDDQLKRLGEGYAKKYDLNAVRLENQVDPSILGGVILKVKDRVIDGSVKNKLKKIRAQLEEK